jgi:hypothetical protein
MKKIIPLLALLSLLTVANARAAVIEFDPAQPLNVVNQGGFVGTFNPSQNYTRALVVFEFTGLNPNPLATPFLITNIKLTGDGITGSLSFADLTITENDFFATEAVNLTTATNSLNFANSLVSFDLPGSSVINDGAVVSILVQYRNNSGLQVNTSDDGPVFEAIPEPSTYALLLLAGFGLAAHRWRRRSKTVA